MSKELPEPDWEDGQQAVENEDRGSSVWLWVWVVLVNAAIGFFTARRSLGDWFEELVGPRWILWLVVLLVWLAPLFKNLIRKAKENRRDPVLGSSDPIEPR